MIIRKHRDEVGHENPHGIRSVKLYDSEHTVIMHLELRPGEQLKPHITPVDAIFYILEGNPTIEVGNESQQLPSDTLIESPKKVPHCIFNRTEKLVRVLVIKTPRQNEKTIFLPEDK